MIRTRHTPLVSVALLGVAATLSGAAPARAQLRVSGSAGAFNVQHRVLFGDTVLEQTGMLFGIDGAVSLGRVRLGLAGLFGSLAGDADSVNPDRTVRATTLTLHATPSRVVAAGLEIETKVFETDAGETAWRLIGGNLRITPALGAAGLLGLLDVSFFPSASVVDGPAIKTAFRGTFGLSWESPRGPLSLWLGYRFERYDFEGVGGAAARLEQFRGAVAGVGLRFGR